MLNLCTPQYPPALEKLIASRNNFAQLEDFNRKKSDKDAAYQEAYHARMEGRHPQQAKAGGEVSRDGDEGDDGDDDDEEEEDDDDE